MKIEIEDYGAGPRLMIYFMQGHAHVITVAQAVELRTLLDEQIREIQLRNAPESGGRGFCDCGPMQYLEGTTLHPHCGRCGKPPQP